MYDFYRTTASLFRRSEWRWRFVAANGRIIAASSEGYVRYVDCVRSAQMMRDSRDAPMTCMGQPIQALR